MNECFEKYILLWNCLTVCSLQWSSELACHLLTIHNEEVARRKEFQSQFEGHFLTSLFPGMDDLPPSFATQAPSLFDTKLPKITEEHIERLRKHLCQLPDLAEHLNVPDMSAVTNFFLIRSSYVNKRDEEKTGVDDSTRNMKAVKEHGEESEEKVDEDVKCDVASNVECESAVKGLPHLKDLDR